MDRTIKQVVKDKYSDAARRTLSTQDPSCCDPISSNLYDTEQTKDLPQTAVLASLGCGNPTALAVCVINLSSNRDQVLREAFRVLKPGGRFAVSDIVTRGPIASAIRQSVLAWLGCVAGALDEEVYREKLAKAGFIRIEVDPTRIYRLEDAKDFLAESALDAATLGPEHDGKFISAFIRAQKPIG